MLKSARPGEGAAATFLQQLSLRANFYLMNNDNKKLRAVNSRQAKGKRGRGERGGSGGGEGDIHRHTHSLSSDGVSPTAAHGRIMVGKKLYVSYTALSDPLESLHKK